MNCARCERCGEIEPYDWDYQRAGLWVCDCKSNDLPTREQFIDFLEQSEQYLIEKGLLNGNNKK